MRSIPVKIKNKGAKTITVAMDADRFERLAASFGFFGKDFIASIDKAERDYKAGRVQKLASLKDLR